MDIKRGGVVIVAPPGDFGKPRPALVLQSRIYPETELITVALITTHARSVPSLRIPIEPNATNGLKLNCYVMVDMVQTYNRSKTGNVVATVDGDVLRRVREAVLVFLGFDEED